MGKYGVDSGGLIGKQVIIIYLKSNLYQFCSKLAGNF